MELIRVGDRIINLANVMTIDLQRDDRDGGEPAVVLEFMMRGADELDEGTNFADPYIEVFEGEEAVALRKYLKGRCPDLMK